MAEVGPLWGGGGGEERGEGDDRREGGKREGGNRKNKTRGWKEVTGYKTETLTADMAALENTFLHEQ